MTYLIFTKFFKCAYVILTDYFLFIAGRLFKYLFLGIFIISKHFVKLLLIEFVMNFAFINIFDINNVSLDVDNVKTFNSMFSLTIMAEDIVYFKMENLFSKKISHMNLKILFLSALVNKHKDFCQTFSLTEIIKEPSRIKCSTSSLLDHILTNFLKKIPKKGRLM